MEAEVVAQQGSFVALARNLEAEMDVAAKTLGSELSNIESDELDTYTLRRLKEAVAAYWQERTEALQV
eukprot:scaffold279000_cov26-Tisochrysis_lutea.AAC.2